PPMPELYSEGKEEHEVKGILNSHLVNSALQYLVSWKGYLPVHNSWELVANLANAM
ncbi:hypothetical protein DACRYDRAFT_60397, partial [Dacryopinax primogenitus]